MPQAQLPVRILEAWHGRARGRTQTPAQKGAPRAVHSPSVDSAAVFRAQVRALVEEAAERGGICARALAMLDAQGQSEDCVTHFGAWWCDPPRNPRQGHSPESRETTSREDGSTRSGNLQGTIW